MVALYSRSIRTILPSFSMAPRGSFLKVTLLCFILSHLIFCPLITAQQIDRNDADEPSNIKFSFPSDTELVIRNGKQEYEALLERKKNPLYGECWSRVIIKLESSCSQLDENRQSWLAMHFTSCFMKTSGFKSEMLGEACLGLIDTREIFSDSLVPHVQECVRNIDLKIFHTYSLFYVHTQSICFYLHSEQWQRKTEHLVDNLVQNAQAVSQDLNSAVDTIRQLEQLQNLSLEAQFSLNDELVQAKTNFAEFQEQTKEQRDLIEKIIDQFILLRQFLLVEFSTNSAIVYYIFAMLVIYFLTTPQRVVGVRLVLYLMLVVGFIFEKNAIDYLLKFDAITNSKLFSMRDNVDDFSINRNIWFTRKCTLLLMASTWIWWMITYKDISQINYRLLHTNTIILKNIQNHLTNSPESNRNLKCLHFNKEENSDRNSESSSSIDSSESFSDYESDDDSFISSDSDTENLHREKYNLRPKRKSTKPSKLTLPLEYANESVTAFVRNVRTAMKKSSSHERLNYYSSDDN